MGCSTGEEAYSIAMVLLESGLFDGWTLRVFGTDLSRKCVATARRGVYGESSFRSTSAERRSSFFVPARGGVRVLGSVRAICQFGQLNLLNLAERSTIDQVDAIFCRNVLIYFAIESRKQVIKAIHDRLRPGGFLMLGHSESLLQNPEPFEPVHLKHGRGLPSSCQHGGQGDLMGEPQQGPVRVLVVDDSVLNRRGIRRILEASGHVQVVGEAGGW